VAVELEKSPGATRCGISGQAARCIRKRMLLASMRAVRIPVAEIELRLLVAEVPSQQGARYAEES
jgi:hypothetical protein